MTKVGKGKGRVVNARFGVMCAHYLFDPDFCNVASGWEKGIFEKNVQDTGGASGSMPEHNASARSLSSTPGSVSAAGRCGKRFTIPNTRRVQCGRDAGARTRTLDANADALRWLCREARTRLGHLPRFGCQQPLLGALRVGRSNDQYPALSGAVCLVVAHDTLVASHERLSARGQTRYDWQHYIPLLQRNRRAAQRRPLCRHARALTAIAPCHLA